MKQFNWIVLSLILVLCAGCTSSKGTATPGASNKEIIYTSLIQVLRGKPGLRIAGSGDNATVIIRGERSFLGNNEPLYMLDDVVVGNTFKEAVSGIDPTSVGSVEIITPAKAGRFGGRGGNGVIVFKSKRNK